MQSKKIEFEEREYGKNPFTEQELRELIGDDPVEKFLNTRTPLYREKKMKEKPPSKEEAIRLMRRDPNLLKRPVIIKGKRKLTGFDESAIKELLQAGMPRRC